MSSQRLTQSVNNSRRENTRNIQIDCDEENHIVGMVIRYLFAVNRLKTVIHGEQIKKICLLNCTTNYSAIIMKVKQKLSDIFGYELIELGGLKYILVNKIDNPEIKLSTSNESAERILLFLTLTYIFMSTCDNNETPYVEEDELWEFFVHLNIIKDDSFQHNYFGNIKKLITTQFVDQLYLSRRKIINTEEFSYEWGARANAEITRRSILEFVSKVYDNRPINTWPAQFNVIQNLENPQV